MVNFVNTSVSICALHVSINKKNYLKKCKIAMDANITVTFIQVTR